MQFEDRAGPWISLFVRHFVFMVGVAEKRQRCPICPRTRFDDMRNITLPRNVIEVGEILATTAVAWLTVLALLDN